MVSALCCCFGGSRRPSSPPPSSSVKNASKFDEDSKNLDGDGVARTFGAGHVQPGQASAASVAARLKEGQVAKTWANNDSTSCASAAASPSAQVSRPFLSSHPDGCVGGEVAIADRGQQASITHPVASSKPATDGWCGEGAPEEAPVSSTPATGARCGIPVTSPGQLRSELGELLYIGQGATGLVYRASLTQPNKASLEGPARSPVSVAVKFMICNTPQQLWQRAKEALLSKLVSHPNLVRTLAMDVTLVTPNTYHEWGDRHTASIDAVGISPNAPGAACPTPPFLGAWAVPLAPMAASPGPSLSSGSRCLTVAGSAATNVPGFPEAPGNAAVDSDDPSIGALRAISAAGPLHLACAPAVQQSSPLPSGHEQHRSQHLHHHQQQQQQQQPPQQHQGRDTASSSGGAQGTMPAAAPVLPYAAAPSTTATSATTAITAAAAAITDIRAAAAFNPAGTRHESQQQQQQLPSQGRGVLRSPLPTHPPPSSAPDAAADYRQPGCLQSCHQRPRVLGGIMPPVPPYGGLAVPVQVAAASATPGSPRSEPPCTAEPSELWPPGSASSVSCLGSGVGSKAQLALEQSWAPQAGSGSGSSSSRGGRSGDGASGRELGRTLRACALGAIGLEPDQQGQVAGNARSEGVLVGAAAAGPADDAGSTAASAAPAIAAVTAGERGVACMIAPAPAPASVQAIASCPSLAPSAPPPAEAGAVAGSGATGPTGTSPPADTAKPLAPLPGASNDDDGFGVAIAAVAAPAAAERTWAPHGLLVAQGGIPCSPAVGSGVGEPGGSGGGSGGGGGGPRSETVPFQDVLYHLDALPGRFLAKVIMEYCDSGTLLPRINAGDYVAHPDKGPLAMLSALRALLWCLQEVAAGMAHLHSLNIIHGDLKPGNVLLTSQADSPLGYVCKVSDFGLATALEASEQTITHENWGTVVYMAPESCAGRCRKASDVYSFGVLLWQMCTGERPYAGMQAGQVLLGVKMGTLTLQWPAWANKSLVKVGQACLRFDPKERPGFKGIRSALVKISARLDLKLAAMEAAGLQEGALLQSMAAAGAAAEQQQQEEEEEDGRRQEEQGDGDGEGEGEGDGGQVCSAGQGSP